MHSRTPPRRSLSLSLPLLLLSVWASPAAWAAPSPSTAAVTVQIDVRGSMMRCFFTGYTFQAEVIEAPAGEVRPPTSGTLHVTLGEGPLDPMALGGVFHARVRAVSPLASGTCAAPAMALDPDRQGRCWALFDASPSPAP